jgi:hypothetical protein
MFAQLRGKRVGMGVPGTALRSLMKDVLKATDALDADSLACRLDRAPHALGGRWQFDM